MSRIVHLEKDYQELFTDLHASGLFPDGKEISDAISHSAPAEILANYRTQKDQPGFDLKAFYDQYFTVASARETDYVSDTSAPVEDHINQLWIATC